MASPDDKYSPEMLRLIALVNMKFPNKEIKTNSILRYIDLTNCDIQNIKNTYSYAMYHYERLQYKKKDIRYRINYIQYELLVNSITAVDLSKPHDIRLFTESTLDDETKNKIKEVARGVLNIRRKYYVHKQKLIDELIDLVSNH